MVARSALRQIGSVDLYQKIDSEINAFLIALGKKGLNPEHCRPLFNAAKPLAMHERFRGILKSVYNAFLILHPKGLVSPQNVELLCRKPSDAIHIGLAVSTLDLGANAQEKFQRVVERAKYALMIFDGMFALRCAGLYTPENEELLIQSDMPELLANGLMLAALPKLSPQKREELEYLSCRSSVRYIATYICSIDANHNPTLHPAAHKREMLLLAQNVDAICKCMELFDRMESKPPLIVEELLKKVQYAKDISSGLIELEKANLLTGTNVTFLLQYATYASSVATCLSLLNEAEKKNGGVKVATQKNYLTLIAFRAIGEEVFLQLKGIKLLNQASFDQVMAGMRKEEKRQAEAYCRLLSRSASGVERAQSVLVPQPAGPRR